MIEPKEESSWRTRSTVSDCQQTNNRNSRLWSLADGLRRTNRPTRASESRPDGGMKDMDITSALGVGVSMVERVRRHLWRRASSRRWTEIIVGNDALADWLKDNKNAILLDESVSANMVANVVDRGYANDLTDDELEKWAETRF